MSGYKPIVCGDCEGHGKVEVHDAWDKANVREEICETCDGKGVLDPDFLEEEDDDYRRPFDDQWN